MAARPRVVAALAAALRDLDAAEEAFAGAAASCLALPEPIPDERLRLLFICCHPTIAPEARTALALKVICGLPVSAIARLFVVGEAAMFQRITRAKVKVREAGIAFELPPSRDWPERLGAVLLALELAFTAAYADAGGELSADIGEDLGGEIERLALLVAELLPDEPEALGLAALALLARSRAAARFDACGVMVPLSQQDCGLWDRARMERARALMEQAARAGRSGPCQVMAAIQLTHAPRAVDGEVDWGAVLRLYEVLALPPRQWWRLPARWRGRRSRAPRQIWRRGARSSSAPVPNPSAAAATGSPSRRVAGARPCGNRRGAWRA